MPASKCIVCLKPFKEGDELQAFLKGWGDATGSWTTPCSVDKAFQTRHKRNQDDIKRKHFKCTVRD